MEQRIARLAQWLLFAAGKQNTENPLSPLILPDISIQKIGNYPLYQSEWSLYQVLLDSAVSSSPLPHSLSVASIFRLSNFSYTTHNKQKLLNTLDKLRTTYIVIKGPGISMRASLVDYFSIHRQDLHFVINPVLLEFWDLLGISDEEKHARQLLGHNDLALWLFTMQFAIKGKVSPPLTDLRVLSRASFKSNQEILRQFDHQISTINAISSLKLQLGKSSSGAFCIAFLSKSA